MTSPSNQPVNLPEALAPYKGRPVYLHEVAGNNGDELILKGSEFIIDRAGCQRITDPAKAELLLINGGFKSDFWPFANETIREYSSKFPNTPLIILPSSFWFQETDFPALFAGRSAPATIFARELKSLEILRGMSFPIEAQFGLDHDTAFALVDEPSIKKLIDRAPTRDLLIVERGDAESATGLVESDLLSSGFVRKAATAVLPRPVAIAAARAVGRLRGGGSGQHSPFTQAAIDLVEKNDFKRQVGSIKNTDVSRRSACSYSEFCETIADSKVIISTRLHVGILGAVMGRRTYIVAGNNHKIPGIYEFSMKDNPCATLISPTCEVIA
ncbi:MAG: hypothetical protein AB8F26_04055 [Phycisphaerales bacterium]